MRSNLLLSLLSFITCALGVVAMAEIAPSPDSTKMVFEIIRHGSRSAENAEIKFGWSDSIKALPSELTVYG